MSLGTWLVGKEPKYCGTCGQPLFVLESSIDMGFDRYTGKPRGARPHVTLRCPTNGHDTYVYNDGAMSQDQQGARWVGL